MNQFISIGISVAIVYAIALLVGKKFRISSRYERAPQIQDPWKALDSGVDPSEDASQERNV